MKKELPTGLKERDRIFRSAVVLERLVFNYSKEIWCPATLRDASISPSPSTRPPLQFNYDLISYYVEYNLRLSRVALAIEDAIAPALRIAGMTEKDLQCWQLHAQYAGELRSSPEYPPNNQGLLYVVDACPYLFAETTPPIKAQARLLNMEAAERNARLDEATQLVNRLAIHLDRVVRTVSPQAVLERIVVDRQGRVLTVDGKRYERFVKQDLTYFWYARQAEGQYVSSREICEFEGMSDFKTERTTERLAKRHPELLRILLVEGSGARIVLPLPK